MPSKVEVLSSIPSWQSFLFETKPLLLIPVFSMGKISGEPGSIIIVQWFTMMVLSHQGAAEVRCLLFLYSFLEHFERRAAQRAIRL